MMRLNEFPTEQELKVMVAEVDQVCQISLRDADTNLLHSKCITCKNQEL